MSEDTTMNDEMLMLLKALVEKVNQLEKAVYDKDNLLMKSGWTTFETPKPSMGNADIDTDMISKMDWDDIRKTVSNLETKGGY